MSNEKMREEFEAAYVEGLVERCGEGFRSSAVYSLTEKNPDGRYKHYPDFIAWWAWQASRAAIEVLMPEPEPFNVSAEESMEMEPEEYEYLESRHGAQYSTWRKCKKAVEASGLKVKS